MSVSAQAESSAHYLLDTSAVLAYLLNESQAGQVERLRRAGMLPFITPCELYAAIWRRFGQAKADEVIATLRQWQLALIWPTEEILLLAGRWRAVHQLGLADSLIAALAYAHHMTLVTKDRDFLALQPDLTILLLS